MQKKKKMISKQDFVNTAYKKSKNDVQFKQFYKRTKLKS